MPFLLLLSTLVILLGSGEATRRAVVGRQLEASLRLVSAESR